MRALDYSPIVGPEGNIEFLADLLPAASGFEPPNGDQIGELVRRAHAELSRKGWRSRMIDEPKFPPSPGGLEGDMEYEKSCGAVVFRIGERGPEALVIHQNAGHWGFPKGHVEPGEDEEQTALREILEETA